MAKTYGEYLVICKGNKIKAKKKYIKQKRKINKVKLPPKVRNYYLYALELEDNFYYVGITSYKDPNIRYQQHLEGKGSKWTKLHKPIRIIETRDIGVCQQKTGLVAENIMTREYMSKFGMYKVRGGDLCYLNSTLVALHFNDIHHKNTIYDSSGRKVKKILGHVKRVEKIQESIAEELSWIV